MKINKLTSRPLPEERELHINLALDENDNWVWEVDTNIPKYVNAFKKRGWEQLSEDVMESDGTVQGASFRSYEKKPISFRDLTKIGNKRVMSNEHKEKLLAGLQKSRLNSN